MGLDRSFALPSIRSSISWLRSAFSEEGHWHDAGGPVFLGGLQVACRCPVLHPESSREAHARPRWEFHRPHDLFAEIKRLALLLNVL